MSFNNLVSSLLQKSIGFRGGDRVVNYLAHHSAMLQCAPVKVGSLKLFMDLRSPTCRDWLQQDLDTWEPGEREVMRQFVMPGDVVYDIGANMGLHTAFLSSLVGPNGKVFTFEPNPALRKPLERTCENLTNVQFYPVGLGRERTVETLYVPADHTMASLRQWTAQTTREFPVTVHQLDGLDLPVPAFIKCDVEGAELEVFQGATRILSHRPVLLFEVNEHCAKSFNRPATAVVDFLAGLNAYEFFVVGDTELVPMHESVRCANIVAIPTYRTDEEGKSLRN
ncbi:MAG TPA: FkbM family methyltransferase [Pyrinomonadaceae bacterium]|nr:FkbM family methyltransferase [Pyrinomonadaceae bacterium]